MNLAHPNSPRAALDQITESVRQPSEPRNRRVLVYAGGIAALLVCAFTLAYHRHAMSDWLKTDFAELSVEDGIIREDGEVFSGTLLARGDDVFALGVALFAGTPLEHELFSDTEGLIVELEVEDGKAKGEAIVYADLRSSEFQKRLPDGLGAKYTLAKWFAPRLEIAHANFRDGKLNGKAQVSRPAGSSLDLSPFVEATFQDNLPQGVLLVYADTGTVEQELHFDNGKQSGPARTYYSDGALAEEGDYRDNSPVGLWKKYYRDGAVRTETLYDDFGEARSESTWYPNGQKKSEALFGDTPSMEQWWSSGRPMSEPAEGLIHTYYDSGEVRSAIAYVRGSKEGPFTVHYESGQLWEQGSYARDHLVGVHKKWWKNGTLALEEGFNADGLRDDSHREWYANGTLWVEANYSQGRKQGEYRKYWKNGALAHSYSYVNDEIEGSYETFHDNGKPWERGAYREGKRVGEFQKWYANGTLRLRSFYEDGRLHGEFANYLDDGSLYELATFQYGNKVQSSRL